MSDEKIFFLIFVVLMFFMHRGHGHTKGGCGGHSHNRNSKMDEQNKDKSSSTYARYSHHH
ncbi:MAG: hypothetical protein HND52_17615 [Ignavibacteriae bacterium]|nr:hypothetical protein [Ignavibacteriota bacterium]NOG99781.1 hypothetical protein [Ignavibacteriota bacterium]